MMALQQVEIMSLIGACFGTNDCQERAFFSGCPSCQPRGQGKGKGEGAESPLFTGGVRIKIDLQNLGQLGCRRAPHLACIAAEISCHLSLYHQPESTHGKRIPTSFRARTKLEEHVSRRLLAQCARRCPALGVACDLLLFPLSEGHQIWTAGPEPELAIEPECSRLNRLFVVLADLVGIHRNAGRTRKLMQQMQHLGIDPRRFTLAKCIKRIEPNLDPFEESDGLEIVDRYSILQGEPRIVSAQRQSPLGIEAPDEQLHASANIGLEYIIRIAVRGTVQLAIANCQSVARHVDDLPALALVQLA